MSRRHISVPTLVVQALRALARHKTRSALNVLGIMVGIAAVVWVVAIGKAGSAKAEQALAALGDNLVWVEAGSRNVAGVRTGTHGTTSLTMEDFETIAREVPQLKLVSPQVDGTVILDHAAHNWTTRYRGVTADYLEIKRWTIILGTLFSQEQVERAANVCVIGQTVRAQLFGDQDPTGQVIRIAAQPFEVLGVLGAKGQSATGQDQDDTIMVPYTTAQTKLRGKGIAYLDDILCSAASPELVASATARIAELLRDRHHITWEVEDDFNIRHPEEVINAQLEASKTFSTLLVSIASVALLVGGIGVMNVMLASVAERTREIGVRLALGAPAWAVQVQFLAEAVLLTLIGGALGIGASVAGCSAIGNFLDWRLDVPVEGVVWALAFSAAIGVVFGFFPARRAASLDPIAALRDE